MLHGAQVCTNKLLARDHEIVDLEKTIDELRRCVHCVCAHCGGMRMPLPPRVP
jgi:hypothetical protein